jgi:KDO2-lipid IV(A) lauroyltransferase
MMESVKVLGMKEKDFNDRLDIQNVEIVNNYYKQGKSVVALTMHYNNWEWGTRLSKFVNHKILAVYKPLHNIEFDKYMVRTRTVRGTELIKNNQILRRILIAEKRNEPVIVWLASDQTPPFHHSNWFVFLNQEAIFYPGPATLSKQFNLPIVFQWVEKTGRSKYKSKIELLIDNPSEKSESEIIKTYIRKMEEIIHEKPEFYLWTHKRWKHKRPSDATLQ